jgi:hypothetical protein
MTIELDWKQLLDQMIASLKFLNRRARNEAIKRGGELSEILKELCKYKIGIFQVKDLPRQEFRGAVQRYLVGLYDDSIHHAFFSVEMGLLVRLEETLPPKEKDALHDEINKTAGKPLSFTFGAVLNKAREGRVGIIHGKKVSQKIESLIDKRNTYVHANNFLSGLITAMKERTIPKIEKELKDLSDLEKRLKVRSFLPSLLRMKPFLVEQLEIIRSMPDFAWCTRNEHRESAKREIEKYITYLDKLEIEKTNTRSLPKLLNIPQSVRTVFEETYFKIQNRMILGDSFEILHDIEIF